MFEKYLLLAKDVQRNIGIISGREPAETRASEHQMNSAVLQQGVKIVTGLIGAIVLLTVVGMHIWLLH
jgi:hypothetical protein